MLGPTLEGVLAETNLWQAWVKVLANKGSGGVDGVSLTAFASKVATNLESLLNDVLLGNYSPLPLLRVEIEKPSGDGKRSLSIPAVRDRVLQTAVALQLTPIFEEEFEETSFAYRKGRSVGQAVALIERFRNQGYHWVVDADIHRYFDEVNHALLMREVSKLVSDPGILKLIQLWLKAVVVDGKERFTLHKGIAQGSPLSPLLANLYLDQLDDSLQEQNLCLVRYADDFVVLCKSYEQAQDALELTTDVLEQLALSLNERKTKLTNFSLGFQFLGYKFVRSLALKHSPSKSPKIAVKSVRRAKPTADQSALKQAKPLPTEMEIAFPEAGITAQQFPSEAAPDASLEPPSAQAEDDDTPPSLDPRLKTLYVMEHGSVLSKEYERFVIKRNGTPPREIPAIHVDQILVFGNCQITTQVMHLCLQKRIPIYLLAGTGKFFGTVDSFDTEPVLLHREQFMRANEPSFCLDLARQFVKGKVANSRLALQRFARHRDAEALTEASTQLPRILKQLDSAATLDQVRGYEGNAARIYFQALSKVLDKSWGFSGRNKNPPLDPVNALLSYGYTLLFYNVYTLLRARGLNPHVGYLHPMRMGHPALVSDVMEEFRALVVDSVVMNLVLNNKLSPNDFIAPTAPGEPCLLSSDARALFVRSIEAKFNSALQHPISKLKLDYRRCIEHQINYLAAVIRQKDSSYKPMVLK
jgi:CRISP-associated protein Cas1